MAEMTASESPCDATDEKQQQQQQQQIPLHPVLLLETEELQQERIILLVEENMRLKTKQSQLQDQREELKRELFAEKSTRQGLEAELKEVKERLQRTRDQIDQQRREHSSVSLRLCSVTAERDELEAKITEVWRSMAALEESVHAKNAAEKMLRDSLDSERKEREAQEVLMNTMVSQLAMLEKQAATDANAEERQRRLSEETLCGVREEAQRLARMVEGMADVQFVATPEDQQGKLAPPLLSNERSEKAVLAFVESTADDGLNMSDTEEPNLHLGDHPLSPIYQAARHLRHQLQRERGEWHAMQHNYRVLEAHIMALKDQLHQVGSDCDNAREELFRSEARLSQTTSTLEEMRLAREHEAAQATEARRKIALVLHCIDDWCVIEQHISNLLQNIQWLRDAVAENRRAHRSYVAQKEEEVDRMMDAHQRELDAQQRQLEQMRHESERFKRAAVSEPSVVCSIGTSGSANTTAGVAAMTVEQLREHEILKAKYHELLCFVEDELQPLASEQASALQEEKQRVEELRRANDALRLEVKLLGEGAKNRKGQLSLFEALVLALRALSGAMADAREMVQQRTALMHYILAYERMFGTLNTCGEMPVSRPVLRFRKTVVAVLAAYRILALKGRRCSQRHYYHCYYRRGGSTVAGVARSGDGRIRFPSETCCVVHGGLIQLPPLLGDEETVQFKKELEKGNVLRVTERDLQLPIMTSSVDYAAPDRVGVQEHALRHFMDALLAFVTVPSSVRPLHGARELLWRRLASGLHALRRQCTASKHRRLMHLPPRPPTALAWEAPPPGAVSSTTLTSSLDADPDVQQHSREYNRESCIPPREPSARVLSYSPWRREDGAAHNKNSSGTYPVPQLAADNVQEARILEEALQQSLLRDAQENGGMQGSQSGNGFASEVLSVIRALDQRVAGALERHVNISDRKSRR